MSVSEEFDDTRAPLIGHVPLRAPATLTVGPGLAIQRSLATALERISLGDAPGIGDQLARTLGNSPDTSTAAKAAGTTPTALVFVRRRPRAVAPPPAAPRWAASETTEIDPMAPTPVRAMVAAADPSTPLPDDQRTALEPSVGADLGNVRIHTGKRAMETAAALRAEAFTIGRDIFFRSGRFEPSTERGRALLAHELTHVRQQTEDGPNLVEQPTDDSGASEAEAESTERFVLAGQRFGNASQLTVGRLTRNYATSDGRSVTRQDRQRLDTISFQAVSACERMLGPALERGAARDISHLELNLSLDLSRLSDDQAAEIWGQALADALRQRMRT